MEKNGCDVQWVNPNEDGSYTSPGEGYTAFVPTRGNRWLYVWNEDGTRVLYLGEKNDGSPDVRNLWVGRTENASWDIVGLFIPGKLTFKGLAAGASFLWAKHLAKRAVTSKLDDILKGAVKSKVSKSIQYIKNGGIKQANKDFDALVGKSGVTNRGGGLRTATLQDGTKVNVRPFSSGSKPTLEIQPPTGQTVKIRYN